ncbi:MAG: HupE/UreJ family protein [Rhodospirillales bacterium]
MWIKGLALSTLALAMSSPALAHSGAEGAGGFVAGLVHPLFGADHLLAMVAVGLWAACSEPRRVWVAPAGFLTGMLAGMVLALSGVAFVATESLIVLSVVLFGALAFFAAKIPPLATFAGAAVLASAHGAAHGMEMPADGSTLAFCAAVMLMTALLLAFGAAVGLAAKRFQFGRVGQAAGGALAAAGLVMMMS